MGIEELVTHLYKRLPRLPTAAIDGLSEEVEKHKQTVGGLAGFERLLQSIPRDCVSLHVCKFRHVRTLAVKHPDDVARNSLSDDSQEQVLRHIGIADKDRDEKVAKIRNLLLARGIIENTLQCLIDGSYDPRVFRGLTKEQVEEMKLRLNGSLQGSAKCTSVDSLCFSAQLDYDVVHEAKDSVNGPYAI